MRIKCEICGDDEYLIYGDSSICRNTKTGRLQCYRCFCIERLTRRDTEQSPVASESESEDGNMLIFGE